MADRFASQTKPSPEVLWPDGINHSSWLQSKVIVKTNDIGADSTSPPADREMSARKPLNRTIELIYPSELFEIPYSRGTSGEGLVCEANRTAMSGPSPVLPA